LAFLAAISDNEPELVTLWLSEDIHLFDFSYPFVSAEFAVFPRVDTKELKIIIHGQILKDPRSIKNRDIFKKISRYALDAPESDGVYDFSASFFQDVPANKKYETEPRTIKVNTTTRRIKEVYGLSPIVVTPKITAELHSSITVITISNGKGDEFRASTPYVFRFGFYLKDKGDKKIRNYLRIFTVSRKEEVHTLCIPEDTNHDLRKLFLQEKIRAARVALMVPDGAGLKAYTENLDEISNLHLAGAVPHTDTWILIPDRWSIAKMNNRRAIKFLMFDSFEGPMPYVGYVHKHGDDKRVDTKISDTQPFPVEIRLKPMTYRELMDTTLRSVGAFSVPVIYDRFTGTSMPVWAVWLWILIVLVWFVSTINSNIVSGRNN
jgi:hypothetical protein